DLANHNQYAILVSYRNFFSVEWQVASKQSSDIFGIGFLDWNPQLVIRAIFLNTILKRKR
ncbi:MAG: hypothetical protein AB2699_06800, partial [Candidatus Thiodiazotropha taylori]